MYLFAGMLLLLGFAHFFLLYRAWAVFARIPEKQYKSWFLDMEKSNMHMPLLKGVPVRLRLRLHYFDVRDEQFVVTVPVRIRVGQLFYHFVVNKLKNDPRAIECEDEQQNAYAWQFYAVDFGGLTKRILNPDKMLIENKLHGNCTILVKRVGVQKLITNQHS